MRYIALAIACLLFSACARQGSEPAASATVVARTPSTAADEGYLKVPVMFGTDRNDTNSGDPKKRFGGKRGDAALVYGMAEVSIPYDHRPGELKSPHWYKLELHEDPTKHIVLLSADAMSRDDWVAAMRRQISTAKKSSELIYIHGYNVSFEDAARRAAQLSVDLGFDGVPAFYSWASAADPVSYAVDEATVDWSTPHLEEFLRTALASTGAENVYVIAHSMGSRALGRALADIATDSPALASKVRDVVFAAPDIDAEMFKEQIAPRIAAIAPITLYASSEDQAIKASHSIHGYDRAGSGPPNLLVDSHFVTIDASSVDTSLLGHSYYGEEVSVIDDIKALFDGKSPAERNGTLIPEHATAGLYYRFLE